MTTYRIEPAATDRRNGWRGVWHRRVEARARATEGARQAFRGALEPLRQRSCHPHPADTGQRSEDDEQRAEREHVEVHGVAELVDEPR